MLFFINDVRVLIDNASQMDILWRRMPRWLYSCCTALLLFLTIITRLILHGINKLVRNVSSMNRLLEKVEESIQILHVTENYYNRYLDHSGSIKKFMRFTIASFACVTCSLDRSFSTMKRVTTMPN